MIHTDTHATVKSGTEITETRIYFRISTPMACKAAVILYVRIFVSMNLIQASPISISKSPAYWED